MRWGSESMRSTTVSVGVCALLVLVLCAGTASAEGKRDCRWIWITGSVSGSVELAPVPTGYPDLMNQCYGPGFASACQFWFHSPKITGTVNGEWVFCGNESWGVVENPSGLPLTGQFWTNPGFLLTKHGVLCTAEQSVVGSLGDFVALEETKGLSGIYEGMTGWLAIQKPVSSTTKHFSFAGWICRP